MKWAKTALAVAWPARAANAVKMLDNIMMDKMDLGPWLPERIAS